MTSVQQQPHDGETSPAIEGRNNCFDPTLTEEDYIEKAKELLKTWYLPLTNQWFKTRNGDKLHVRKWMPQHKPTAVLVHFHGYTANNNTRFYTEFFSLLVDAGYAVLSFCQPGHGGSLEWGVGTRAKVSDLQQWLDNMEDFMTFMLTQPEDRSENPLGHTQEQLDRMAYDEAETSFSARDLAVLRDPSVPVFMAGQSLGGLCAFYFTLRIQKLLTHKMWDRYRGTIFCSPALAGDVPPEPLLTMMQYGLPLILNVDDPIPKSISPGGNIPPDCLYDDPVHQQLQRLAVHDSVDPNKKEWGKAPRLSTGLTILAHWRKVPKLSKEITQPFIIIHDPEDRICPVDGSYTLMKEAQTTDRTFISIPDMRHQIFCTAPDAVAMHIDRWVQKRL